MVALSLWLRLTRRRRGLKLRPHWDRPMLATGFTQLLGDSHASIGRRAGVGSRRNLEGID